LGAEDETTVDSTKLFHGLFAEIGVVLLSQHLNTATYVWRILQTHMGSPAFQAQLVPYSDYIIGCDAASPDEPQGQGLLTSGGEALLSRVVLNYYNQHYLKTNDDFVPITLYVYNHDYDILRPVTVNLSRSWGTGHNKGVLGCDVGYGLLHRIPEVIGKFGNNEIVDDLLFENKEEVAYNLNPQAQPTPAVAAPPAPGPDAFVPLSAGAAPPPPRGAGKKKKHVAPAGGLGDLQDYMNEELAKSKEQDVTAGSPTKDSVPPPPPISN
jgi:hypothetical protein